MLLAASTTLSKDMPSYRWLRRFMMTTSAALTLLHILIVFTPLYYVVAGGLLGLPEAVLEPARLGLMIMVPWTWSIAYRRFNQGVLIRFGHSRSVGTGSLVWLSADVVVFAAGYVAQLPGVAVAAAVIVCGVMAEAVFAGVIVRPVIRTQLSVAPPVDPPLALPAFTAFYVPLVLTSFMSFLAPPLTSVAPQPHAPGSGLAGRLAGHQWAGHDVARPWPELQRSRGGAARRARRCAGAAPVCPLAGGLHLGRAVLHRHNALGRIMVHQGIALSPELAGLASSGLRLTGPIPGLVALQSWYQGTCCTRGQTRASARRSPSI